MLKDMDQGKILPFSLSRYMLLVILLLDVQEQPFHANAHADTHTHTCILFLVKAGVFHRISQSGL